MTKKTDILLNLADLDNAPKRRAFEAAHQFTYAFSSAHQQTAIEALLQIRQVPILGKHQKGYGVFLKDQSLVFQANQKLKLGVYEGQRISLDKMTVETDTSYVFALSNEQDAIDAKPQGNWTRFINSTFCAEQANVEGVYENDQVVFYLKKTIKAHEQLLFYYGDLYFRDIPANAKVFLKPADSYFESDEIVLNYAAAYRRGVKLQLSAAFLACFDTPYKANQLFHKPNLCDVNSANPDLPLLACNGADQYLLQEKQENITLLMHACFTGALRTVSDLLQKGANPNIQTSFQGVSVFHLLVAAPLLLSQKISIANMLHEYGAVFHLQDKHDRTFLYWAIARAKQDKTQVNFINHMLDLAATQKDAEGCPLVIQCIDENEIDVFIYALQHQIAPIVRSLLNALSARHIQIYLERPVERNIIKHYIEQSKDSGFLNALKLIINQDKNLNYKNELIRKLDALRIFSPVSDVPPEKILSLYANFYLSELRGLDIALSTALQLPKRQLFKYPNADLLCDSNVFVHSDSFDADMPLLAYTEGHLAVQDNITLLMLSCFEGNMPRVKALLAHQANPMLQTRLSKYTALHFIAASSVTCASKKQMIQWVVKDKALLFFKDNHGRTMMYGLIMRDEAALIQWLIEKYPSRSGDPEDAHFLSAVDADGCDVFLYAMKNKKINIVDILLKLVREEDIRFYLESQKKKTILSHYVKFLSGQNAEASERLIMHLKRRVSESAEDAAELTKGLDDLCALLRTPLSQSLTFFGDEQVHDERRQTKRMRIQKNLDYEPRARRV